MTHRTTRAALAVSWLLTAVSIALAVHLRTQNGEQAERIRRLEAATNLRGLGRAARIYQERSFSTPLTSEPDGQP